MIPFNRCRREAALIGPSRPVLPVALILLLLAAALPPQAGAAYIESMPPLASGRVDAGVVTADGATYLFGGYSCSGAGCYSTNNGMKYDHATGTSTTFSVPLAWGFSGAASDGERALLFPYPCGSCGYLTYQEVNLSTYAVMTRSTTITAAYGSAIAWVDGSVYVLGGYVCPYYCQDSLTVSRYTPATGQSTVVGTLAEGARQAKVAVDGTTIYLVYDSVSDSTLRIQTYDTATNAAALAATTSYRLHAPAVAVAGGELTVFGGVQCTNYSCMTSSAIRTLASDGTIVVSSLTLPSPRERAAAVVDGNRVLVMGGISCPYYCETPADVTAYYTTPSAPTGVAAASGAAPLTIDLSWDASPAAARIVGYEVYRGVESGELTLLAELDNATTSFVDAPPASTEPYFYAVKAVNGAGASPMSAESCAIVSPVGHALVPACAVPAGAAIEERQVVVEGTLVAVDGGARGDAYAVNATLAGESLPGVGIYDRGLLQEEVHQGAAAPVNASASLKTWSPGAQPCLLNVGSECLAPVPLDPTGDAFSGATLAADVEAGDVRESFETPFLPYAGAFAALLP